MSIIMLQYSQIIERLYALNESNIKLGLENISNLLKHLGNPHKTLKTIHIAGTNGKGSTGFFLNSIFKESGYKTGLYTSPHLVDIRERITVGARKIPQKSFIELSERIFGVMDKENLPVTFFEFVTALSFLYFVEENIDIGIIEVGLGGRLDATNVINPLVSVITEIGLEHTQYLGSSIKEIALEKGGIIKEGVPVFISAENNEAVTALNNKAIKEKTTCFQCGKDFTVSQINEDLRHDNKIPLPQIFSLKFQNQALNNLEIETAGTFQVKNSATAAAVSLHLRDIYPKIDGPCIREGLKNTRIPCRMELVQESPYIVLDTAHNLQAIETLVENIERFFTYKRLIVLLGMMKDKDYENIIKAFSFQTDIFIMTEPESERALSADLLKNAASACQIKAYLEKKVANGLNKAKQLAEPDDLILITGSFYILGEVLFALSK